MKASIAAALAGGVAALEDDDDALAGRAIPALQLDELELAGVVGVLVGVLVEPLPVRVARVKDVLVVGMLERLADLLRRIVLDKAADGSVERLLARPLVLGHAPPPELAVRPRSPPDRRAWSGRSR